MNLALKIKVLKASAGILAGKLQHKVFVSFTVAGQRRTCTDFPRYLWWLLPTRTELVLVLYHACCRDSQESFYKPPNPLPVKLNAAIPLAGVGSKAAGKARVVARVQREYRSGQFHLLP